MQPQILSSSHLKQGLKDSQDSSPWDFQAPIPLSKAYFYQLINTETVEMYTLCNKLVYVLQVPLTSSHNVYDVYRILPFPITVTNMEAKCTFIQPQKKTILIDKISSFMWDWHKQTELLSEDSWQQASMQTGISSTDESCNKWPWSTDAAAYQNDSKTLHTMNLGIKTNPLETLERQFMAIFSTNERSSNNWMFWSET
jgi:hypothetical protein